jgi:hypothetical protein
MIRIVGRKKAQEAQKMKGSSDLQTLRSSELPFMRLLSLFAANHA